MSPAPVRGGEDDGPLELGLELEPALAAEGLATRDADDGLRGALCATGDAEPDGLGLFDPPLLLAIIGLEVGTNRG